MMILGAVVLVILVIIVLKMLENPMDDSGEFNGNIFPFEIKDPEDWFKSKPKEEKREIQENENENENKD